MAKPTDSKLNVIKFARVITYLVYAYFLIATVFLILGFFLLLFGANPDTSFVKFVYHFAAEFLAPFRGIFPTHQISDRSYFSAAGLFAIIMYGIGAMAIHALINYITLKEVAHQNELQDAVKRRDEYQTNASYANRRLQAAKSPRPTNTRRV